VCLGVDIAIRGEGTGDRALGDGGGVEHLAALLVWHTRKSSSLSAFLPQMHLSTLVPSRVSVLLHLFSLSYPLILADDPFSFGAKTECLRSRLCIGVCWQRWEGVAGNDWSRCSWRFMLIVHRL